MDERADPANLSNQRGLIVAHIEQCVKRVSVRHTHIQHALATLIAGSEFRINAFDPAILLQELQLFLQRGQ